ncbi:2-hydroxy-6-oxononadienedioate/2-hydroxy-6-oxononatrienedioate hydrolase [Paraburkholderia caffeinitolerans]|uniref:2-hydroxy-6-oxononadienedioate/2-hydroxy-6-oxononatrienedioate hydrolase n=1 Tax=Paraburkholderia caffeinitolerans TaxID=1723730 RepID=A0A6J5G025_9BURK|nr:MULTISPECIES: alpha/beta fold hydrolase [Paraburkholderia]CAB3788725.1 2-hydroxy-6-oxononadienedioate/2-hydroxy-6-oxononatrienedioate hydrolase [Paraburkholderia caffeinitolerans]
MSFLFNEAQTSREVVVRVHDIDYKVHYNDVGCAEDPVVVMLHGSGPGATGWANYHRNIDAFAGAGYRVLLINVPGFGKSDPVVIAQGSRSEFNGQVVRAVLDQIQIDKISLIGNSMGAHSATAFVLANPDRVHRLVCMGGGTGGPSTFVPQPTEGIKLLNFVYREPTLENVKRMMNVFVFDPSALTDDLLQQRVNNMQANKHHLENWVSSMAANPRQFTDYQPRLPEIEAPTLIVWGREDRFVPYDIGLCLLSGLQDAEFHMFNRCGHWVQWEHAEKFNRMVLDFLSR